MTTTAPAASEDNGGAAPEPVSFATSNDLDFEMTPEQEQAFVNETLGIGVPDGGIEPKEEPNGQPDGEQKPEGGQEPPVTPKEEEAPKETPKEEPTAPKAPTEVAAVQTDDLWIEVEKVSLAEDGTTKSEKVKLVYDPNDPSSFVPDDFAFKNDKQLADILEAKREMADLYKEREAKRNEELEKVESTTTQEEAKQAQLDSWDAEIEDLVESGILEAPKVKPGEEGFLEDPSVQRIDSVFKFMAAENDRRAQEGKPPITSFGTAYTKFAKVEADKAEEERVKQDNDDAKRKSGLIGGSSAAGGGEQKTYVAGSYKSIMDVPVDI